MKVMSISAAVKQDRKKRPGIYRKKGERTRNLPCAWTIGDARSFAKIKSFVMEQICLDPKLGGKAKAVIAHCLKRMNCHEQWSCFVSIPQLAEDSQTSEPTCWRAIHDADGTYIATWTEWRNPSQTNPSTHITIHPGMLAKLSNPIKEGERLSNMIAVPPANDEAAIKYHLSGSQICNERLSNLSGELPSLNFLQGTSYREDNGLGFEAARKKAKVRKRTTEVGCSTSTFPLEFQNLQTRQRGNREERFVVKGSLLCRYLEQQTCREVRTEADGGHTGRWMDARELARDLGLEQPKGE